MQKCSVELVILHRTSGYGDVTGVVEQTIEHSLPRLLKTLGVEVVSVSVQYVHNVDIGLTYSTYMKESG